MSGDLPSPDSPEGVAAGNTGIEPWRWHLDAPHEVGRFADLLKRRDRVIECVTSGRSMGRSLPPGSRVRFRCGPNTPRVGDVVMVLAGPTDLIAHRVVGMGRGRIAREFVITRGDATPWCDEPVRRSAVLGIVRERRSGDTWVPIAPPVRRGPVWRVVASAHRAVMLSLLRVDYRLAGRFAAASYWLIGRRVPGRTD